VLRVSRSGAPEMVNTGIMELQRTPLPYSRFRVVGDLIFFSGIVPLDAAGEVVSPTFADQFAHVMSSIHDALAAAGVGLADVVQTRCYLVAPEYFDEFNRLYREAFVEPYPSRTTIVAGIAKPGVLLEIEMVAARVATSGAEA